MDRHLKFKIFRNLRRPAGAAGRKESSLIREDDRRPAVTITHPSRRSPAPAFLWAAWVFCAPAVLLGNPVKGYGRRHPQRSPRADLAVRIPVVVRDRHGKPIGGLTRRDFRLRVDGRVQPISDFAENIVLPPPASAHALAMPRYIALYFDDLHMSSSDVIRATDGADGYFAHHLGIWDRVGIFTASGQNTLEFTHDWAKIHHDLLAIHAQPPAAGIADGCPAMTDFEAYLIDGVHQAMAREVGIEEALRCLRGSDPLGPSGRPSIEALRQAARRAEARAHAVVAGEEQLTSRFLDGLGRLIARVAPLPDPKRIVVVSPGFLIPVFARRVNALAGRAAQFNIAISTIDVSPQLSQRSFATAGLSRAQAHRVALEAAKYQMEVDRASVAADALMDLAAGTGGNFVPNAYDPEYAFPMAVPLPRSHYVLTFYVSAYRANGGFHRLQVELLRHPGLLVQAPDSYFAPDEPRAPRSSVRRAGVNNP